VNEQILNGTSAQYTLCSAIQQNLEEQERIQSTSIKQNKWITIQKTRLYRAGQKNKRKKGNSANTAIYQKCSLSHSRSL